MQFWCLLPQLMFMLETGKGSAKEPFSSPFKYKPSRREVEMDQKIPLVENKILRTIVVKLLVKTRNLKLMLSIKIIYG